MTKLCLPMTKTSLPTTGGSAGKFPGWKIYSGASGGISGASVGMPGASWCAIIYTKDALEAPKYADLGVRGVRGVRCFCEKVW
jgi:hypothetical protein